MKSTKVQTLGADHAIEHLTLHETLDKLVAKTLHITAKWIRNYKLTKLHCHILSKKGEKKVSYALPGFELGTLTYLGEN